jgi:hypothetical protein
MKARRQNPFRPRRLVAAMLLAAAATTLLGAAASVPTMVYAGVGEAEVAAAYVYKFCKFIKWPARSVSQTGTLKLCVYGRTATSRALDSLSGKSAQGLDVRVQRRDRGDALDGCHVVYVGESERRYLSPLLRSLANRPTLTVSEIPGFIAAGGMIGLVNRDNRLRFEINAASADAAGLMISSQLLKLATRVVRE